MKTLLFTGGGGAASEALDRLLRDRYIVHFADADPQAKPPSIAADRWHVIPTAPSNYGGTNPDFIQQLSALCRELSVDVLIPGVDEELRGLAYKPAALPCALLLPHLFFVVRHLDKFASMRSLELLGLPYPKTQRLRPDKGGNHWPAFPCILKPREGRGSRHVRIVRSVAEGEAAVLLSGLDAADFITQEYLVGQEYTCTLVANQAKQLRAVVPVRVELKRGITLRAETDADEAVIQACACIHAADPFAGIVNVQCIKTASGEVKPFEINPRVSTTTCLAIAAGVDVIGLALETSGEGLVPFDPMVLRRSWQTQILERWQPTSEVEVMNDAKAQGAQAFSGAGALDS